jgi:small conductance mechanosensitive channel
MKTSSTLLALLLACLIALMLAAPFVKASKDQPADTLAPTVEEKKNPLVAEAEGLMANIQQLRREYDDLKGQLPGAKGEDLILLQSQIEEKQLQFVSDLSKLTTNVMEQKKQGLETSHLMQQTEIWLKNMGPGLRRLIDNLEDSIKESRNKRESIEPGQLLAFEEELAKDNARLDRFYKILLEHIGRLQEMGLDADTERSYLAERLAHRADTVSAQIRLSAEQIAALEARLKKTPDNPDLQAELLAAEEKVDRTASSLTAVVEMMNRLDLETAEYSQLLIQATGEITGEIFDTEVALGLFQKWMDSVKVWAVDNGPRILFKCFLFLLILVVFKILARFTGKVVRMSMASSKLQFSQLLQNMFVSVASNIVLLLGLLVALSQLGFKIGPLLAGLGVAGFIIGFALQDTLGNFASGMMILIYRPYDVGDLIEAGGAFGKVSNMSLVCTTILTIDNQTLVVPNSKIWGDVIKNVTAQGVRRVDMVFGISYSDDIPHAEKVLQSILEEHDKVLKDPEPMVKLHTLGESSVDFIVRPWVNTADYWEVYWDVTREVKMRFDREGIAIPFPQRDVHFSMEKSAEEKKA